jgi:hypothetical protein
MQQMPGAGPKEGGKSWSADGWQEKLRGDNNLLRVWLLRLHGFDSSGSNVGSGI